MPLASSSFDPCGVQEARRSQMWQLLERTGHANAGAFLAFHRSHAPQRGPYSPCMHRAGVQTVSFTWVIAVVESLLFARPAVPDIIRTEPPS